MSLPALRAILGDTYVQQMIRDKDAEWEAENGICAGDYYANVCEEDRPPSPVVSLEDCVPDYFAGVAMPNPVSQDDGEWSELDATGGTSELAAD
jgi:hypothetical protein